ncbi:hypothetical protein Zmor_020018 [Zophobas morio]|uniref:Endonuclease-reverse transcriptase n=1 Tax=Zophobas morio TaxID=2755281 RepID=A0AA38I303_9CUCU|nr:hypothetical protein Zmor_020018 [Zophobas morio]
MSEKEESEMTEIRKMFSAINRKLTVVEEKLDRNTEAMITIRKENLLLKESIKDQDSRLELLEKEVRKNNIIIQGVADENDEKEEKLTEKIQNILTKMGVKVDVEIDASEIRRIGTYKPNGNRPILVKLQKWKTKMEIYKLTKNLKGSDIWINDDFSKKVQAERKCLTPYLQQVRQQGSTAYLRYNKMIIDGKVYGKEHFEMTVKSKDKRTSSERSPLSEEVTQQSKIAKN